jgi:hypothetical protein
MDSARGHAVEALPIAGFPAPAHGRSAIKRWPILARLSLILLLAALSWTVLLLFIVSI